MATQGRKNVHGKGGVRFKAPYTSAKFKSELRNVVSSLFIHEQVEVTRSVAKQLIKLSDRLIERAKKGDLHNRRLAASVVRNFVINEKEGIFVLDKLFDEIGPRNKDRQGGYTRILKLPPRRGDNAPMFLVSLVK